MKMSGIKDQPDDTVFDEYLIDAQFKIETTGRDESCAGSLVFPYEPTSYSVLKRLTESGMITDKDHIVDYGSGKGRAAIYFYDRTGAYVTGVELVRKFYEAAEQNLASYANGGNTRIEFLNMKAEDYVVPDTVNRLFFFNPFHFRTLKRVMTNVLASYKKTPRHIRLFFYYPQNAYIAYLSDINEVMFFDEIDCMDLFREKDDRNRIMIFEIT